MKDYSHKPLIFPYHGKTVTNPERGPASRTVGDRDALTMHGDHIRRHFTYDASGKGV